MKTNTRLQPQKNERDNAQMIIFGNFQQRGSESVVVVGSKHYIVSDIKSSIKMPISHNAKVKALVRPAKAKKAESVKILRVLAPELTINRKIDRMLDEADIATDFQKIIYSEANMFGDRVSREDMSKRCDLSALPFCTIDGETAKDFDDAVFAREADRHIEVMVAIADVSHYVKAGSALDEEAFERGTSIYYPGHCIPMLPEQLSNGLCSLKPDVPRLALMVSFHLGPKGGISRPAIKEVVIKSKARLTYNQVQAYYDQVPDQSIKIAKPVQQSLNVLRRAALILRAARARRGAIDFDLVESVVALDDQGEPVSIHPLARLDAHRIIEDLMVATNEVVAGYFAKKNIPCLYRVHEPPNEEKLENFFKSAEAFGALPHGAKKIAASIHEPKDLQQVMSQYQKSQYKDTLNTLMLRAMMQARYSEQNLMHFGLASSAYLHFTSPIRRYADLIVHRQLRSALFEKQASKLISEDMMAQIGIAISQREIKATDLERKIDRLYAATFMASRVGDCFDGIISACTEFGFFVRIIEHHVEGLVHIANIAKARVNFVPEKMSLVVSGSHQRFMVGDHLRVKLINVNIDRGHIDFEIVKNEDEEVDTKLHPPKQKSRRERARKAAAKKNPRS